MQLNVSLANDGELFLGTRDGELFLRNSTNSKWELQEFSGTNGVDFINGIYQGNSGIYVTVFQNGFYRRAKGTNIWQPMHGNLEEETVHAVSETPKGTIFVASPKGIFRTTDDGKKWKHVFAGCWANTLVSNENLTVASTSFGIIQSTDNGETWSRSFADQGSVYNLSIIQNRFVAIRVAGPSYTAPANTKWLTSSTNPPNLVISPDGGATWQYTYIGLAPDEQMFDIERAGEYLFCTHKNGISRTPDLGKNWELVLPTKNAKDDFMRYNIVSSGHILYAILVQEGC